MTEKKWITSQTYLKRLNRYLGEYYQAVLTSRGRAKALGHYYLVEADPTVVHGNVIGDKLIERYPTIREVINRHGRLAPHEDVRA